MDVHAPSAQYTMTTKEMLKTFSPIILFSIILPLIDIVTDLRIIIRLFSGVFYCIPPEELNSTMEGNDIYGFSPNYYGSDFDDYSDYVARNNKINRELQLPLITNTSYDYSDSYYYGFSPEVFGSEFDDDQLPSIPECELLTHHIFATLLLGEFKGKI